MAYMDMRHTCGFDFVLCQLCAVAPAATRSRTRTEPREATLGFSLTIPAECEPMEWCCQPLSETGCSFVLDGDRKEHIAGPGCRSGQAYCGANISVAEMKWCSDIRAIKLKDDDEVFEDEDDDEPWERETKYFFSGICREINNGPRLQDFDKRRHGHRTIRVANIYYDSDDDDDDDWVSIPVHTNCWEIFKRVSMCTLGFVDVHGFWKFRSLNHTSEKFHDQFPRHPAVRNGYSEDPPWDHEPGDEWTVANPIDIPGLASCLKSFVIPRSRASLIDAFPIRSHRSIQKHLSDRDPFSKLPAELRSMVQELLPSSSIAALRSASFSMRSVPNYMFRRLLFEDMPWLWEARDLPPMETSWFRLYKKAKWIVINIKGVKNRARIWKEVSEICRRIGIYREKGKIRSITGWESDEEYQSDEDDEFLDENI